MSSSDKEQGFQPIRIVELIVDEVGSPRGDGSPGSALYSVPFRLSCRSPHEWSQMFIAAWDHPSSFTTMHRPGIASVVGDRVVLNGTTIEEVEKHHRETLVLAAETANKQYVELLDRRREMHDREKQREEEHRKKVEEAAKRVQF